MPRCSVIVAAYDAAEWLPETLASLAAQEPLRGWTYDVAIGVDACPATAAALDADGTPYYWTPINVGAYVLRNSLIAATPPADCYAIFDADDLARPSMLRMLIPEAMAGGAAACGKQQFQKVPGDGPITRYGGGICVFRADAWAAVGGYHPDRVACDTDLVCRMNLAGVTLRVTDDALYDYRRHPKSLTGAAATNMKSKTRTDIMVRHETERMQGTVKIVPVTTPLEHRRRSARVSLADLPVSVVIPAPKNSDCPHRAELLRHCLQYWERMGAAEILEVAPVGQAPDAYCKAAALNVGAAAAAGDVLIFADADVVLCPARVAGAVRAVASGRARWAAPNSDVLRLNEDETSQVLAGVPPCAIDEHPYTGQDAGGMVVISRELFAAIGGADARFVGWGGEDSALSVALRTFAKPWRPTNCATLVHLWHPPAAARGDRMQTDAEHNGPNHALWTEYRKAEGDKLALAALRAGGYETKGTTMQYEITRGTVVAGQRVRAGQVVDVPDSLVVRFSLEGLIRPAAPPPATNEGAQRDAEAVASVPKPARKRRAKGAACKT